MGEIARKNFVAGFSRSLGSFVVTLLSWTVIAVVILKVILPSLNPVIAQLSSLITAAGKLTAPSTTKGTGGIPIQIPDNLLQQLQAK